MQSHKTEGHGFDSRRGPRKFSKGLIQWLGLAQSIGPNRLGLIPLYPPIIFHLMTKAEPVFETL
jgi:hypothetical protein